VRPTHHFVDRCAGRTLHYILHVEDDPDVIQITQALVEDVGGYTFATTLGTARAQLAARHFDLVLLDLTLPDGSGLELLDDIHGRTPVVVFSGQEDNAALSRQVAAALTKSRTSNEQFLATIRQVMEK
jgi:CheY-like chemotaxis protein